MTETIGQADAAPKAADGPGATIDKVRDLLFGEQHRQHEEALSNLEAQLRTLEARMDRQFAATEAKLAAMSASILAKQDANLRDVGEAFMAVGRHIAALGGVNERGRGSDT